MVALLREEIGDLVSLHGRGEEAFRCGKRGGKGWSGVRGEKEGGKGREEVMEGLRGEGRTSLEDNIMDIWTMMLLSLEQPDVELKRCLCSAVGQGPCCCSAGTTDRLESTPSLHYINQLR